MRIFWNKTNSVTVYEQKKSCSQLEMKILLIFLNSAENCHFHFLI